MSRKKTSTPNFEACLAELGKIVERMERGEQSLEESLEDFEHGIELTRRCQKGLKEAEQRVEKLIRKGGEFATEPYAPED